MKTTIITTVFLKRKGSFTKIFFSELEIDQYFEDNKHIISQIIINKNI